MTDYNWAPYERATGCTRFGPAGAQAIAVYLEDWFPGQTSYGICNCREVFGGTTWSHHAECRAYDEGFAATTGQRIGIETLELLGPHGARIGIDHLIVNFDPGAADRGDPRIYSASSPQGKTYTGAHPHKNHNHIGLTRAAGVRLTYATLVAVAGAPPSATPPPPSTGGTYTVNVTRSTVKKGDKGTTVAIAQSLLAQKNHPPANSFDSQHRPDGIAGSGFDTAARNFQKAKGLTVDGIVGPNTWTALEKP
jgi:hypothetical protein